MPGLGAPNLSMRSKTPGKLYSQPSASTVSDSSNPRLCSTAVWIYWGKFTFKWTRAVQRPSQVVLVVKNTPANAGGIRYMGSIPGLGRSPGGGHGNPFQYSCLENLMAGYSPQCLKESDMTEVTQHTYKQFKPMRSKGKLPLFIQLLMLLLPSRHLCPWDFPGKNTAVRCHFLLQGIFPTQGSNWCLLHWQVDSLLLSHQGSPAIDRHLHYFQFAAIMNKATMNSKRILLYLDGMTSIQVSACLQITCHL